MQNSISGERNTFYADTLEENVKKESEELQETFSQMVDEAYVIIYKKQICVEFFAARLANLTPVQRELHGEFLDKVCDEITQETTVLKLWLKLTTYWNFLNYFLLEQVILKFGDTSLQVKMRDYKRTIRHFQKNTHLRDFANCSTTISMNLSKNLSLLAMKFEEHWDEYTLEDLEKFENIFTHQLLLSSFALTLKEIKPGCIHVTWAIPAVIGASLKKKMENVDMRGFCKEHGVTSISIDGEECKYSATVKGYLRYLYSKRGGRDLIPFKLASIEKKEVDRRKCDEFTRSTLRGDQDDIVYTKQHMDENEIGIPGYRNEYKQQRFVLIEGAPGVGKTTFSEEFCYKWSRGQVLTNHRLLVLLPLRDNRVRSARNVSDLFQHPQLQQAIAEEVESSGGEGVALWLEAWDELGEEMRNKSSIFLDFVHGHVLPKATVIVTSRPWATKNLREDTNIKLDQHVEIVSTPSIQFNRVLGEGKWLSQIHGLCEPEPHREAKFIDYVNNNPSIKAAMHTPVTADIVAEVFQWSRDTESTPPTTMTQLYTAFTCKLLMQHLSSHKEGGSKSGKIRSLEEIPADMKGRLLEMCRLAWEGVVEQQLTFSSDVVGGDTLGLMQGVRELYGEEDGQLSYHFIHLTLQEFLSAYHITQLPLDKQEQHIRENVRAGHLNRVVRFYFGLTKPNHFTTGMILEHLSDGATAYHWLFEAGDVETFTEELGSERAVRVKSSYSWSPLDYYVVGHSVAHYQFQWELDCSNASMGDEGMEMLSRGMASSAGGAWNGKIACNFYGNDISLEGVKWFVKIPLPLAGQIDKLYFADNKLDVHALNAFSEFGPKLAKLQELSVWDNPIGKGGAVEVFKCLHHCKTPLKKLDLTGTGVGEEDCAQLALLIANTNTLEVLNIGENLSSNSVASIMEGLLENSTILQSLIMYGSHFSEENCMSLASLLQQAECQLRMLLIRECNISGEGAVHLAAALTNNHSLAELYIPENSIGDIGATAFGDMVRNNTALTRLDLGICEITSEGCVQLAAGLTENTTLQRLWMSGNHVGVEGAKALSKVIEENKTLRWLGLYDDDSLGEGVDSLLASLQNNTTLEKLVLSEQYQRPADHRVEW